MGGELNVTVLSDVDTEVFERLEDNIRGLLEREGLKGNSHHLTQEICEKLDPVIIKKIDLVTEQKMKIKWRFNKEG